MLNRNDGEGKHLLPHNKVWRRRRTRKPTEGCVFVVGVVQERHRRENTSFHAQCGVGKATTTKRHQRWCLFMLGVCWGHGKGADHKNTPVFATLLYGVRRRASGM